MEFFPKEGLQGFVNFVPMSVAQMTPIWREESLLAFIGDIAGECYNSSRDLMSCIKRAYNCIERGHHSPWEHHNITLKCVVDRGTSHAIVRHRHCAFQQSSTIYQNYGKQGYIDLVGLPECDPCTGKAVQGITLSEIEVYQKTAAEYLERINESALPHRARDLLPNALATTLIVTTNVREWMYIIQRRQGAGDAVRMHCFAMLVRAWFEAQYPNVLRVFEEWYKKHPL